MKTILIVGGAGFIGSQLAQKLVHRRHRVIIYDNFSSGKLSNLQDIKTKIIVLRGDILNFNKIYKCIADYSPNVIFHLAAMHHIPDCVKRPSKTYQINVNGTKNILDAISQIRGHKPYFVFVSSAAVYKGINRSLSETVAAKPIDIYGQTKLLGERLVKKYCSKNNIAYSIIRLFNTYGPGDTVPHVIPRIVEQLKVGNVIRLGNIAPKRDFIFIDDVVSALTRLLIQKNSGVTYNLGTGKEYSIKYLIRCFRKLLKVKEEINIKISKNLFRKIDRLHLKANTRKIRHDLGWQTKVNIERGLKVILKKEGLL